jgi:ubiquinone/menaquinone biosynthesis C-methylase UbiE
MTQQQYRHAMLPDEHHDDLARETFVRALKSHIAQRMSPGVRELHDHRVSRSWALRHGKPPADRHEVREALCEEPYYQLWSSFRRASQDLLWNTVGDVISRQSGELAERAKKVDRGLGTLTLDSELEVPRYQHGIDIHAMPGGYRGEYLEADVSNGALYDRGVYVYAMGQMGALNDDYGQSVVENYLKSAHPDFTPERILDMGCTVGNATLPYVDAYPRAEVYAIDLGAPVLRYAHARAEALGRKVHFSQQNAEQTNFPDEHFDLVVSHILLHECPPDALRRILVESHRVLKPGGLMIHADFPGYAAMDPLTQAMIDWDTYNNNEPFWGPMRDMDLVSAARDVGFTDDCAELTCPRYCVTEILAPTGRVLQSGDVRGTGKLWLLVGRK